MNVAHRTICESPAPEYAVRCRLPFSKSDCIVTGSGNKLQIYAIKGADPELKLVWEKNFWGDIFGVFRHCSGEEYDSIIVGCDTSKIVILQVVNNELKEVEFHDFHKIPTDNINYDIDVDEPTLLRNKTILVSDPTGTCLAMLIAQRSLYLLPLSNKNKIEKSETAPDEDHSNWKVIRYAVRYDMLLDFQCPFYRVRDIVFLDGYKSPTLAIMHELKPTWSVRLPVQHSTVCVTIVSPPLVFKEKEKVPTWTSRPLPHNSYGIFPVPVPVSGFLVISKNALIYMTQTSGSAISLNQLAYLDDEVPIDITSDADGCYEIYTKVSCALDPFHILLTVDQHYFAVLTLHYNGVIVTRTTLTVNKEREFHPSVFVTLDDNLVFLGSNIHDSELSRVILNEQEENESSFLGDYNMTEAQISIYQEFFKELPRPKSDIIVKSFEVTPCSYIRELGTVVTATPCVALDRTDIEEPIAMALGCGFKQTGCIHFLRTAIPAHVYSNVSFPDITALFSSENFHYLIASTTSATTVLKLKRQETGSESIVLPQETSEIADVIIKEERTIMAADFNNYFVQITPSVVRVIKNSSYEGWSYEDLVTSPSIEIKLACISTNAIVVLLKSGTIMVFDRSLTEMPEISSKLFYRIALQGRNLFVLQTNNILKVFSLETMLEVATFDYFRIFPDIVNAKKPDDQPVQSANVHTIIDMNFIVFESLIILCLLPSNGRALLYQWVENKMFFRRIHHRRCALIGKKNADVVPFQNISGFSGAFIVNNNNPYFILSESGYPRIIPVSTDGFKPRTFVPIDSNDFPNCFVMANDEEMRICDLSTSTPETNHYIIDGCIVERKHIGQTVRCIAYAHNWNAVAFVQSTPLPFTHENEKRIDVEVYENLQTHYQQPKSPDIVYSEEDKKRIPKNTEEHYSVCILMEHKITTQIDYANHEIVNSVAFVHTTDKPEEGISKLSAYLAVGSGFMSTDEKMMRGVLYLYKAVITSTDDDKNEIQLRCLYNENNKIFKNPILAITENSGYIALFLGNLLYLMRFYNEGSVKIEAFLVGRFFASTLVSLKNYLLYADSYEGFEVARWRKYGKKLISMARDTVTRIPLSAAFIQQEEILGGIVFDNDRNAHIFDIDEYAIPVDAVVRQSMFHINGRALNSGHFPIMSSVQTTQESKADQGDEINDEDITTTQKIVGHITWYATTNGTIGAFTPIEESDRHRLCIVQATYEKCISGLSHYDYRCAKFKSRKEHDLFIQGPELVVDMDLLLDLLDAQNEFLKFSSKGAFSSPSECVTTINKIYYNGLDVFQQ